jgi:hypothetical protein
LIPLGAFAWPSKRQPLGHLDLVRFQPISDLAPDLGCAVAALAEDGFDAATKVRRD